MSPRTYGILHRMHHAYTDTELDPHSPEYLKNVFQMMLRTRNIYNKIHTGKVQVEERFTRNPPEWMSFDRIASSPLSRILWSFG